MKNSTAVVWYVACNCDALRSDIMWWYWWHCWDKAAASHLVRSLLQRTLDHDHCRCQAGFNLAPYQPAAAYPLLHTNPTPSQPSACRAPGQLDTRAQCSMSQCVAETTPTSPHEHHYISLSPTLTRLSAQSASSSATRVRASPVRPALPVRPMRCT